MPKVTVEIDDTLKERVELAIEETKQAITEWLSENNDADDICLQNDINYSGTFNEIVDSNTPIYTSDIEGIYFLHSDDLDQAYENAGIYSDDERPDNFKQVSIYLYIEQQVSEWFYGLDIDAATLDDWRESESEKEFDKFMQW